MQLYPPYITKYLELNLGIPNTKLQVLFNEKIKDEADNYNFLMKNKFDKTLPKLIKKLHNKKVVLYGAGSFLELIKKYFDISKLNVIGISDKRFSDLETEEEFLGYKAISPNKIKKVHISIIRKKKLYHLLLKRVNLVNHPQNQKVKIILILKKVVIKIQIQRVKKNQKKKKIQMKIKIISLLNVLL